MRRVTINTSSPSPRSTRSPTNSNANPASAPDSLRASVTSMDPSILTSSNRVDQQKMSNSNILGSYSSVLNTSSSAKASKLLKSSTGDSASGRGAFSFEKMWRERVGGDAILSSITSNSTSSSATHDNNNNNSPAKNTANNLESMKQQNQQRRFATAPPSVVSGVFIQDAGSAFLGIPDAILSSAERSAVNAQFSSSEGNISSSLVVPRDLTKIRVGLSTALRVSVGIPDDIMYDLLVIGKTGVCLLKVMQQQKNNDENNNNNNRNDERSNKNNDNDHADDDFTIMMDPRSNRNRGNNAINSGESDEKKKSSSSTLSAIKQVEVSMQALLDVAKWIKYQMDSDKHPIDAAAEDSPHRERLECLNSEVADSLSLFEAASTSHNHLANVNTHNNNNNNNSNATTNNNINNSSGANRGQGINNNNNNNDRNLTAATATTATAQFRLTPRAALASVRCEPPAPVATTSSSSNNKKKKKENDSRRKSFLSRSADGNDDDGKDDNVDHEKDGDENSLRKKKKSGKDKTKGENSSEDSSSDDSSCDDDDSSSDSSDGENGKKSSGSKKNRNNYRSTSKKSGGSSSVKSDENASDRASNNNNNRKRSPPSAGQLNDNSKSNINKKKPKAPEVEARKEFKKFMARDPWRQTAAALFASLGGDVFESINGSLPFPVVERVVRLTLHRRIEHAAVEGAVLFLSSKYEGRRLTLVDFDFDVVRPLARLLGCDSGSGGGAQNGNQGDVGISSQIRAAQHVIKLFMTPASKLARDEAARFRGKRNFKDSDELLLAAKFSIERVKNRLSELRIIDPHVEKIFKNSCILEGTGLTHILDLSRFALQDFVQKVKDNRPIAVNPAMVLRRKIVDRFINVVERAARTLYDHSSACLRCKKIAEVIRNHINEQRQKDSTFHQQYYERQKSMMLSSKSGKNTEKNKKKNNKKNKSKLKQQQRKITSDASFESLIEMHESDSDDDDEEEEEEEEEESSTSSSSETTSSSSSADDHDLTEGGSKNDSVPLLHIEKSHSHHHRKGDQSDEDYSVHIANLSVATAKFAGSSVTAGAGSVTSKPLALASLMVSPSDNQSLSGGAESKKRPVVVSFDAERKRRNSAIVVASSDTDDSNNSNDSSDFSSLSDNLRTEQPSASSTNTKLESEKQKKRQDKKKKQRLQLQAELSPFEPLLVSSDTIRNTSFGAHFASDEFSASGEGNSDVEEKTKSKKAKTKTNNNPVLLIPKPPSTSNSKTEQKGKGEDRKKQVHISEGKTVISLEKNAGGKNNSKRPSTSSSATSSHQHHHVCRPPPKAELYVKPTDSVHEQRLRSGQIREIFRMIQMKDATCGKLGAIREQEARENAGDKIGPGWQ